MHDLLQAISEDDGLTGEKSCARIWFDVDGVPESEFKIEGLWNLDKKKFRDFWPLTGGADSTLSLSMYGDASDPSELQSYRVSLEINSLGSRYRAEKLAHGFIGDGWIEDRRIVARLSISPESVRDLLFKVYVADAALKGMTVRRTFALGLARMSVQGDGKQKKIWFQITSFHARSI